MTKAILFLSCLTDSEIDRISRGAHPCINPLEAFSINDLMGNDFVKIKGREVNGGTEYEDNTLTAAQFFGRLNPAGGDLVEIEDDLAVPDGVADEVEFDLPGPF